MKTIKNEITMYEIIDDKGTVYSSNYYDEILEHWENLVYNNNPGNIDIEGDLRLVQVLDIK